MVVQAVLTEAAIQEAEALLAVGNSLKMQEQPTPQQNQSTRRYSDAEASEIYKRAAQIESKTLFTSEDDTLSRDQMEEAANRAGLSDEAVSAAIAQIERERVEAQQQAVVRSQKRRQVLIVAGVLGVLLFGSGALTQRGFSRRLAEVETQKAKLEVTLQRRQDLVPNILALVKENLGNQRQLVAALNRPEVDSATIQRAVGLLQASKVDPDSLDEMTGTQNRVDRARRDYSTSVAQYNRNASSFPASLWRPMFGFPKRIEPFAADKSAQVAPKFEP